MLPIFMLATILALSAMDYEHLARTIQVEAAKGTMDEYCVAVSVLNRVCLLYTSPSPRDRTRSRMPSSA